MEVRIRAEGDGSQEALASLHHWLGLDPDVQRTAVLRLELSTDGQGTMSGAFDPIMAITSNSIALGSLIMSYRSWRDARAEAPKITIEVEGVRADLADDGEALPADTNDRASGGLR